MFAATYLPIVVLALWLSLQSVFNFQFEAAYGDVIPSPIACVNPPCQQDPPPVSGYPSYGAPPPPSPPPSGYSIYNYPPPPPHKEGHSKCPPAPGVQCCTPPAPYTYGPPNPNAPPINLYAPPNPYTYVPYGGAGKGSAATPLSLLAPLLMVFYSFAFLF